MRYARLVPRIARQRSAYIHAAKAGTKQAQDVLCEMRLKTPHARYELRRRKFSRSLVAAYPMSVLDRVASYAMSVPDIV
eukprot:140179-Rhodomonas_salina.1